VYVYFCTRQFYFAIFENQTRLRIYIGGITRHRWT